ncbi:MAG TPA: phosphatidylserine decarboxylase family protein [Thermodesulfobacteriaceae bacterium]|nr:phosphatidylserine decarboxylase family protein [Thermodesulfobacteriaceae bacterium]
MLPQRIPVAREGVPFILISALAAVIFALLNWEISAVTALAVTAFVLYFFRDPERIVPCEPGLVLSPADGRIIEIADSSDASLQGDSVRRISIFMNVFNVHVNRAPISGTVEQISYSSGSFFPADKKKAMLKNEQNALLLKGGDGFQVTVIQIAGLVARRIVCWAETGDNIRQGRRFGMIRFGSRLDVYIPDDAEILVHKGQKVQAGQSVLARTVQ